MLGLVLLYWLGKYFYNLAEEHNKSKWGFTILGIVVYYAATFVFGFITGAIIGIVSPEFLDTINEYLFGLCMLPFGLLSAYLLYKYLEKKWEQESPVSFINEIGKKEEFLAESKQKHAEDLNGNVKD